MPPPSAKAQQAPVRKPAAPAPRWIKPLVLALSAFFLLGWFATPMTNTDAWWQLKTGQYIVERHVLPVPDPFSFTTYMRPAAYAGEEIIRHFNLTHEWLSQVLFYLAYSLGGFPGLILFRAFLLTAFCATVGIVVHARTRGFYRSLAAGFAASSIAILVDADRPFLFTFLFVAVTMAIVENRQTLGRWVWGLPALFLFWANVHGGYFMGWVVLGAYCAESLFFRWRGKPAADEKRLWTLLAACFLISGLNPNFFNVFRVLLGYRQSYIQGRIWEWQHTKFWEFSAFTLVLYLAVAVLIWQRNKVRPSDWLLFLTFTAAAIQAVRNVPLVALMGPVVIAAYIPWKRVLPPLAEFAALLLVIAVTGQSVATGRAFQLHADEWQYPSAAADFLLQHHVTQRMFNTYELGGYLMWRLWPQEQVFIDGRALNDSVFLDYRRISMNADSQGAKSGEELLKDYGIQVIVMNGFEYVQGQAYWLVAALSDPSQKEWKLVYYDDKAVIYMRQPPPGVQPLNSYLALGAMESQCALHIDRNPAEPGCARNMGELYARIGDVGGARRLYALYLQHKIGPDSDAEAVYRRLLNTR